jgi:hypothetical protein
MKKKEKKERRIPNHAQIITAVQRAIKVRDATNKNVKEVQEKRLFGRQHLPLKI